MRVNLNVMYTNKASTTLAITTIVIAIALMTAGSVSASALSAKTKKHMGAFNSISNTTAKKTSSPTSHLISCVKALGGKVTLTAVDNCYNSAYSGRTTTSSSALVPLGINSHK
jgi:hypothetical protein